MLATMDRPRNAFDSRVIRAPLAIPILGCKRRSKSAALSLVRFDTNDYSVLGDELSMPTQNRIGCDQRADFTEMLTPQRFSRDGQAASLVVREPQPFLAVQFFEDSIMCPEVFDELLLLLGHPTGQNRDEQLPRLEQAAHAGTSTQRS